MTGLTKINLSKEGLTMTNIAKFIQSDFSRMLEPWDILFKDIFSTDSFFLPITNSEIHYPVDIYEDKKNMFIEIAAAGLNKEDINIEKEDSTIYVSYSKEEKEEKEEKEFNYFKRGIARRSFDFSWKLSPDKFDLDKIEATMDKGILKIQIPKKAASEIVKNKIKIK